MSCNPYLCFAQPLSWILFLGFFSLLLLAAWAFRKRQKVSYPDTGESGEAYDAEYRDTY